MVMTKSIFSLVGISCTLVASTFFLQQESTSAQTCNYFAGTAVTGQSVNVDLCSITPASSRSVDFIYYLGDERVVSQANCAQGTWISFPERQINRPQSRATQRMLEVVCSYRFYSPRSTSRVGTAIVFDPPSNVRVSPNGDILCSVRGRSTINIYGSVGSWYYTDVCGSIGVIHSSQVRF